MHADIFIRVMFFFLLALPVDTGSTLPPDPEVVKVGSQARLSCPEQPGFLFSYYSITWTDSLSGEIIATHGPSRLLVNSDQFRVDEDTLDLLIEDVTLMDSNSLFQCVLEVIDTADRNMLSHPYQPSQNITLKVYSKKIMFSVEGLSPSYTCVGLWC